jgi:hypothetical protein
VATDIARKLCLTAALVGAVTRKDLAAAFRRVDPATPFDLERAHKWLQGRARPRERRVYEDWARLVDLGEPAEWVAECAAEAFLDRLCARHGLARETLLRRAEAFGGAAPAATRGREAEGRARELPGTYVCYSHAWSPYFRGRLIRGALSIAAAPGPPRLLATYTEALPTGPMRVEGAVTVAARGLHLDLRAPQGAGGAQLLYCLFPPTSPTSVLGGLMSGLTIIGSEPEPSVTRIVMVRLPAAGARLGTADAYLPPGASLAADLAALGLAVAVPDLADRVLAEFLAGGGGGGLDQPPMAAYRAVVELFDRQWLDRRPLSLEAARLVPRRRSSRA